jgi:hypothetical protein
MPTREETKPLVQSLSAALAGGVFGRWWLLRGVPIDLSGQWLADV